MSDPDTAVEAVTEAVRQAAASVHVHLSTGPGMQCDTIARAALAAADKARKQMFAECIETVRQNADESVVVALQLTYQTLYGELPPPPGAP